MTWILMPDGVADPLLDDGKFIGCPKLFSIKHTKKGQTSPLPANFTILMGAEFGRAQLGTSTVATMTIMYSLELVVFSVTPFKIKNQNRSID